MQYEHNFQTCYFLLIFLIFGNTMAAAKTGYFWHITDVHLDANYTTEGDPAQMCWSIGAQGSLSEHPSEFGNYNCDAPVKLVVAAVNAMKDIYPNPDFIIWTGDDTAHVSDSFFSDEIVLNVIGNITTIIMDVFPDTMVLPVLGNHDLYPQNQAPASSNQFLQDVAKLWSSWLKKLPGASGEFSRYGRYRADIPNSKITFLALNTLLWYRLNDITNNDPYATDPTDQFSWVSKTINDVRKERRKVYLMGHIPPGSFERYFEDREGFHWYQDRYNEQYIKLVKNHHEDVAAQFFGHHHTDTFRVFTDDQSNPISFALLAPAVSPLKSTLSDATGANNPGIRLIAYDTETGKIEEVFQYYNDLAETIESGKYSWVLEYNLTQLLELDEISPSSLYEAALRMKNDRPFFDRYHRINTVMFFNTTHCADDCRLTQVCAITKVDYKDFRECNVSWSYFTWAAYAIVLFVVTAMAYQWGEY